MSCITFFLNKVSIYKTEQCHHFVPCATITDNSLYLQSKLQQWKTKEKKRSHTETHCRGRTSDVGFQVRNI